jgi:hypothetical protein
MAWTYEELKAADAELGIEDPVEAAVALNAQTATKNLNVKNADIHRILSTDMEYSQIVLLSEVRDYTETPQETVELAIWALDFLARDGHTIAEGKNTAAWDKVLAHFDALPPVSDTSMDMIRALRTDTVLVWEPPVTEHDVEYARSL